MCRSIKTLRAREVMATESEIEAAALQYVRKVSGYRKPSPRNAEAFEAAVREISEASQRLMAAITTGPENAMPLPLPVARAHSHDRFGNHVHAAGDDSHN